MNEILEFYRGKKVLITGHTGFKGMWMCKVLAKAGAKVTGYALSAISDPDFYGMCHIESIRSVYGDVRDLEHLKAVFIEVQPEIVIHMAAQPLVRDSYKNPVYTYEVNVLGTVNVLECIRMSTSVKSFINVTTDKVYLNKEWMWGYRENDELNGYDPYSNSKSCSELVTSSYKKSFFENREIAISTVRAGNVIGGGDFAKDRIIPDCIRAIKSNSPILVRNPHSVRPYQHVLEPVFIYLYIAMEQYKDISLSGAYNVGPDDADCITTGELVDLFCTKWNENNSSTNASWKSIAETNSPHESMFLKLDTSKIKNVFGWRLHWHIDKAVEETVNYFKVWMKNGDLASEMSREIEEYMNGNSLVPVKEECPDNGA